MPDTGLLNTMGAVVVLAHKDWLATALTTAVGLTVIVNVLDVPTQLTPPLVNVGVTVMVAVTGALVTLVAIKDAILPAPVAPKPIEGSGIKLETNGGGMIVSTDTVAVLWFGGYATPSEISKRAGELLKQVEEDGTWKVKVCTVAFLCPYVCIYITLLVLYVHVFTLLIYYVSVELFFSYEFS